MGTAEVSTISTTSDFRTLKWCLLYVLEHHKALKQNNISVSKSANLERNSEHQVGLSLQYFSIFPPLQQGRADPYSWGLSAQMAIQMPTALRHSVSFISHSFLLPGSSVFYEVSSYFTKSLMSQVNISFKPGSRIKMHMYNLWQTVAQEKV